MLASAKRYTKIIGITALSLAFVAFAIDNREVAHVSLFPLPYAADLPLFLFAIFVFFVGAVIGYGCSNVRARRLSVLLKAEQKKNVGLQNQVDAQAAERLPPMPPKALAL